MATGSSSSATPAIGPDQLEVVLRAVKDSMREEMASLKRELAGDREAADERLLKKMRLEKAPTFRKKTHEKQFKFNEEVACKVEAAKVCLSEAAPAVEKAKTLLEEGEKLISERQKLIRMADRSEHGWATVEEYLEDELAENSDDEKRMQKAEYRAGRKLKAAAAKTIKKKSVRRPEQVSGAFQGKTYGPLINTAAGQLPLSGTVPIMPAQQSAAYSAKWPGALSATAAVSPPLQGPCFNCGRVGHVKKFCPLLQGGVSGVK